MRKADQSIMFSEQIRSHCPLKMAHGYFVRVDNLRSLYCREFVILAVIELRKALGRNSEPFAFAWPRKDPL